MSIARPQALLRRAVAVPVGVVGRIDAVLDNAMARVDTRIDSGMGSVFNASRSFAIAASRSLNRTDCVIERRYEAIDASVQARIDSARRHGRHSARYIAAVADGVDFKLDVNVAHIDRVTQLGVAGLVATGKAVVHATESLETNFETKFATADSIFQSGINKAQARASAATDFARATVTHFDARIEAEHARVDRITDLGLNAIGSFATATLSRVESVADATDSALVSRISRIDNRIDSVQEVGRAAYAAMTLGIQTSDLLLTNAASQVDVRIDRRIAQGAYAYTSTTNFVMNATSLVDRNLDQGIAKFDTRLDAGFAGLVRAAQGVSYFASDLINDLDGSLANRVAGFDRRIEAFVIETQGPAPIHAGQRASSAPPWVATTLTLVLGTLGAATGAAALNAEPVPVAIDKTVKIEASAAHQAVQQYLGIRESFAATQASRSRQIASLKSEIAAAKIRANKVSLPGSEIIDVANNYGGVPYVRGGTSPKGFDCSGYTSFVYGQLGISLPRTAAEQAAWATPISSTHRKVGDLMFWGHGNGVYHVGIYAGDGMMWDSPYPGRRVGKVSIWGNPSYGRVPSAVLNGAAVAEIVAKTAELADLQAAAPSLSIKIDAANTLPEFKYVAPPQAVQ